MAYEIEKNVEMPPNPVGRSNAKYPWRQMDVGDSFLHPAGSGAAGATRAAVQAARAIGGGIKFATRKVEGGVRIWRVA